MTTLDKQLACHAERCERLDANRWKLAMTNGHALTVSARRDEGFLLLDADTGLRPLAEQLYPLLEGSRKLSAAVKLALSSNTLRLRAEFPLPEEDDAVSERVHEHLEGIRSASDSLRNWASCEAAGEEMACPEPAGNGQAIAGSLMEVLKEAGWPYHERPGGALFADLEATGQFLQAEICPWSAGARFCVTLYRNDAPSDAARQALCLFLLEANAALRYTRAFLQRDGEGIAAGFEVRVQTQLAPAEAAHALAALSVAGRHCAREMDILKDEAVAGIFRLPRPL